MSAQAIDVLVLAVAAASAISADTFVTADGSKTAGADANTLGVARSDVAAGNEYSVTVLGTAVVVANGAVSAGDALSSDADGHAVVTDGTTYTQTVARALEAATDGQRFEALLIAN